MCWAHHFTQEHSLQKNDLHISEILLAQFFLIIEPYAKLIRQEIKSSIKIVPCSTHLWQQVIVIPVFKLKLKTSKAYNNLN